MRITGTADDDLKTGTAGRDRFFMSQGGDDLAEGLEGDDNFHFGAAFTADDTVAGGDGRDHLRLHGSYAGGVTFGATTMTGIERLLLTGLFNYVLTIADETVAAGERLTVRVGAECGFLSFDGSAETDGRLLIGGSTTGDLLIGGRMGDRIDLSQGGADNVQGGRGPDTFLAGAAFGSDAVNGGSGKDTLVLDGAYASLSLDGSAMASVETLRVAGGHGAIGLTLKDTVVEAGKSLTVDASALGAAEALTFDASQDTDAAFNVLGGAGADMISTGFSGGRDTVAGGGGDDTIEGWTGPDEITGGAGADTFFYKGVAYSTGVEHDVIGDVNFNEDRFILDPPTGVDNEVTGAAISAAGFDSDLAAAVSGHMGERHAIIVTASTGDLAGHSFLVVDVSEGPPAAPLAAIGAGYQAGYDYVFDITGYTGLLDLSDFS